MIIAGHVLLLTSAALAQRGSAFIAHHVLLSHSLPYTSNWLDAVMTLISAVSMSASNYCSESGSTGEHF